MKRKYRNVMYAPRASKYEAAKFYNDSMKVLEKAGIRKEEQFSVIFGISTKCPENTLSYFNSCIHHKTIVMKCLEPTRHIFRLGLNLRNETSYITGSFSCPNGDCCYKDQSFEGLAQHHLTNHRQSDGDEFSHRCCEDFFPVFEMYCAHVYKKHRKFNINMVDLYFRQTSEESLKTGEVILYESFKRNTSMEDLIDLANQIILNFRSYWVFMWNCQDFATWYLYTLGIPLSVIDPTYTDRLTGSSSECSVRTVQKFKGWAWYKKKEQLRKFDLEYFVTDAQCAHCEYMPPLSYPAYVLHSRFCQRQLSPNQKYLNQPTMEEMYHVIRGANFGHNLDLRPDRVFTVYFLQAGSNRTVFQHIWSSVRQWWNKSHNHASLIFQPWILDEKDTISLRPCSFYFSAELRENHIQGKMLYLNNFEKAAVLSKPEIKPFKIRLSIRELVDYYLVIFSLFLEKGQLKNCVEFAQLLSKILYDKKLLYDDTQKLGILTKFGYREERSSMQRLIKDTIEKDFLERKHLLDIHGKPEIMSSTFRARVTTVATLMYGNYAGMSLLHPIMILVMLFYGRLPFFIILASFVAISIHFETSLLGEKRKRANSTMDKKLYLVQYLLLFITHVLMLFDAIYDFQKIQSVALMQLIWSNFFLLNQELENRVWQQENRIAGIFRINNSLNLYFRLMRLSKKDIFRTIFCCTLFLPTNILAILVLAELTVFIVLSKRSDAFEAAWYNFTGTANLEFNAVFIFCMYTVDLCIVFFGHIETQSNHVSTVHTLILLGYFSIHWVVITENMYGEFKHSRTIISEFRNGQIRGYNFNYWDNCINVLLTGLWCIFSFLLFVPFITLNVSFSTGLFITYISMYMCNITLCLLVEVVKIVGIQYKNIQEEKISALCSLSDTD